MRDAGNEEEKRKERHAVWVRGTRNDIREMSVREAAAVLGRLVSPAPKA